MQESTNQKILRCAIYTRKSHEEGLEQEFNSLDAQRDSAESYIESQRMLGWRALPDRYDDGGYSGSTMERPALQKLLKDIDAKKIDVVVVYKIDRLSRSLVDFTKMVDTFNQKGVCFVSVTQHFSTTDSTGRMMLNILMTFAQYEREVIADRIRDKVAAAKRRGKYCGGIPILGYDVDPDNKKLVINEREAQIVKLAFERFLHLGGAKQLARELNEQGFRTKAWLTKKGKKREGALWNTSHVYRLLNNKMYIGFVSHNKSQFQGEHKPIIEKKVFDKVQLILSDGKSEKVSLSKSKTLSPLKGVIKCGHCGCSMGPTYTIKKGRYYTYYICEADSKRAVSTCPVKRIAAGDIEKTIYQQVSAVFKTPSILSKTFSVVKSIEEAEHDRLVKEKNEITQEINIERQRVLELMRSGLGGNDKNEKLTKLNQNLIELGRKQNLIDNQISSFDNSQTSESDVANALHNVDAVWNELFPIERNRLIRLLVENIIIQENQIDLELKTDGFTTLISEVTGSFSAEKGTTQNE